jgi:GGDEF domain-containing protein
MSLQGPASLQGPLVIVADRPAPELSNALAKAGAFPVVDATWDGAPAAIAKIAPAAVVLADADVSAASARTADALNKAIAAGGPVYMPVIERCRPGALPAVAGALPIAAGASSQRIVARLGVALRVRTLDLSVRRRAETLRGTADEVPDISSRDPIEDATVLVLGRGRAYPELSVAVGERVGLIGALSVENAARHLNSRDCDGVVVGDGFGPRIVEAFLTLMAEDVRFRDLPVCAMTGTAGAIDNGNLPNLDIVSGTPTEIVARMLPLVRQHALAARLERVRLAIEAKGMIDPETGLFTVAAFLRDLQRAVADVNERGGGLSIARFSFDPTIDRRTSLDAARLASRLVRSADFACQASDGSILMVFSETALRNAHVVARRIASVLKHTMLTAGRDGHVDPSITLATLKDSDTVESLVARVNETTAAAAG